jgi:hypothetical protein
MEPNSRLLVLDAAQTRPTGDVCAARPNQREVFMDKKLVGAIGAIAGLATLDTSAQATPAAAPAQPQGAKSFAELLDPIPNAVAALRAADAAAREQGVQDPAGEVQVAGYRHHHHHRYRYHHHHHHHRAVIVVPGVRIGVGRSHHHHHHHHSNYYRGY